MNSAALVPVSLISTTLGRPQRFALICAPVDKDFVTVAKLSKGENTIQIIEQTQTGTLKSVFGNEEDKEDQGNEVSNDLIIALKGKLVPK